ncbi:NAD-dependent epimerase/dehydratase [Lasiodiplodia theobromae]|nr:NAD-dependent epimerase/dehydratase [Lasiodiplodia theobromae]
MPSAIVTGATGILGREIVRELGKSPQQWPTVYALSRSKKDECPSNVKHSHIDLGSSASDMARELKEQNVSGEYIFFAAYLQKESQEEQTRVNGDMLENFLHALEINGTASTVKRIVLVCGAKQYGVHLGRPKNPMEESDPWLPEPPFPPNFYYRQQRVLQAFCLHHKNISWTVTYPNDVIGFARGNFMNLTTSLGIFAALHRELGSGTELPFPGSEAFYTMFDSYTSAALHAQFCVWAALEPRAADEAFNVVNGDVQSWQAMWPRLARRYGLKVPADQFARPPGPDATDAPLEQTPPVAVVAKELGLEGRMPASRLQQRIDLVKWAQKEEVKAAWERMAVREGLEKDALRMATWGFAKFVLGRDFDLVISMSKARKIGWTGYKDTWENFEEVLDELEKNKVLPQKVEV